MYVYLYPYLHVYFPKACFNVIGLLGNNKDAVYYYTTLLTAFIPVCFCLNMFQTNCTTYDYSLYTQPACLWVWLITSSYMILLAKATIHICTCLKLYISGRSTKLLLLHICTHHIYIMHVYIHVTVMLWQCIYITLPLCYHPVIMLCYHNITVM